MKTTIALCFFLLIFLDTFSQNTFQKVFGNSGNDGINSFGQCSDGGFYMMGGLNYQNLYEVYIAKADSAGTLLWQKEYRVDSTSIGFQAGTLLSDGSFIMICHALNSTFQIKFNTQGDTIWCKSLPFLTIANRIIGLPGGNFAVSGRVYDNLMGIYKGVVLKLDANGDIICFGTYDINYDEPFPNTMKLLANGNISIAGYYMEHISTHPIESYFLILDDQCSFRRVKIFKANDDVSINALEELSDGSILLAGNGSSMNANFILRNDTAGTILWSREFSPYAFINEVQQVSDSSFLFLITNYSLFGTHAVSLVKTDYLANILWENSYTSSYGINSFPLSTTDNGIAIAVGVDTISNLFGNYDIVIIKTDSLGNSGCAQDHTPYQSGINSVIYSVDTTLNYLVSNTPVINTFYSNLISETSVLAHGVLCSSLGVDEMIGSDSVDFTIFPNPSADIISVHSSSFIESEFIVEVYDMMGRKIFEMKVPSQNSIEVDISNLTNGIYIITFNGTNGIGKRIFCKQ